jgi:shikimate kinase
MSGAEAKAVTEAAGQAVARLPSRSLVLVGLMGAGKSCIGRKLAARLGLAFLDADQEIEKAAGLTVEEIFATYGEAAFRAGERRVIQRLLEGPVQVLATGGGAYMDPATRRRIAEKGIAIWLKADLELLVRRTGRKGNRPLLQRGEPREVLARLMEQRHPIYAEADFTVDSSDAPPDTLVDRILTELERRGQLTPATLP